MDRPWFVLTAMCAFVSLIVLFCVIFGGYSSLLRSQNRIQAAFNHILLQVEDHYQLNRRVQSIVNPKTEIPVKAPEPTVAIATMLSILEQADQPLTPDQVKLLPRLQDQLTQDFQRLKAMPKPKALSPPQTLLVRTLDSQKEKIDNGILSAVFRYNKEARYFNARAHSFPVKYIARLFSLDQIGYLEIHPQTSQLTAQKG